MSEPPPSQGFLAQLRRRRVGRVAAVYGVGAWALIQGTGTLVQMLELPSVVGKVVVALAVVGFPIALVLAWVFDWTPDGIRRTDVESVAPPPRTGRLGLAIGLPILLLLGAGFWFMRARASDEPASSGDEAAPAIAIMPFSVQGPPDIAYLGEGIVSLLGTKLNGTLELRSVDAQTLLKAVTRANPDGVDVTRARSIANDFGARQFITGSIVQAGTLLHIDARLWDADSTGALVEEALVEGPADSLFVLIDRLAGQLLGSQLERSGSGLVATARATTHSLDALKAYLEGEAAYRRLELPVAVDYFQRAVELDSTFAMAHYRLSVAAAWGGSGRMEMAEPASDAALRHVDRLPQRERALVHAYAAFWRGDTAAISMYRELTTRYPDDAELVAQMGESLYHHNPRHGRSPEESLPYFNTAMELDPGNASYAIHAWSMYQDQACWVCLDSLQRRYETGTVPDSVEVLFAEIARGAAIPGGSERLARWRPWPVHVIGTAAISSGDARLIDMYAPLVTAPPWPRDSMQPVHYQRLSSHATALGMHRASRQMESGFASSRPEQWSALLASVAAIAGSPFPADERRRVAAMLAQVDTTDLPQREGHGWPVPTGTFPLTREYLLGLLSLNDGDPRAARARASTLDEFTGPDSLRALARVFSTSLRAHLALRAGKPADALRELDSVDREQVAQRFLFSDLNRSLLYPNWLDRLLRADALTALGRDREALGWLAAFHVAEARDALLPARGPVWLRRAELHERLGQREEAARFYARVLALWRHADPEYAEVIARVEQRLAALGADR